MHSEFTMLMSLALDGEATQGELRRLHEHTRVCAACTDTWFRWQALDSRLAAAPFAETALDLAPLVSARLDNLELRKRRVRWLGSGLFLGWVGVAAIWAVIVGAALLWGRANPDAATVALSALRQFASVFEWIWRGAQSIARSLGAPALAVGFGTLACCTCALGMAWLWLADRGRQWNQSNVAAA